jgi:hypothetical protein
MPTDESQELTAQRKPTTGQANRASQPGKTAGQDNLKKGEARHRFFVPGVTFRHLQKSVG